MKIKELITNNSKCRHYTGLSIKKFDHLVNNISLLIKKANVTRIWKKNRPGAGRPATLTLSEKVAMTLMYYRHYDTQATLGDMGGIHQSNVSRIADQIGAFIEQAADPMLVKNLQEFERNKKHMDTLNRNDFLKEFPVYDQAITDATETPIPRPGADNATRKLYYSGKTKAFTLKTQVTVSKEQRFLHVTATYPGSFHDKTIMDIEMTIKKIPKHTHQMLDSGYQGVIKEYPDHYVTTPTKKPKKRELSDLAKENNRNIAKRRIKVENALAPPKKFAICVQVYRGKRCKFNQIFRNVVALCNLMLDAS
jgi:2'-5' RNA ligase